MTTISTDEKTEDIVMTELLRRAVATMLTKLNEHNPRTGYLFAVDHDLTRYLVMLTLVPWPTRQGRHACACDATPMARALETIEQLEKDHHARHTRTHRRRS